MHSITIVNPAFDYNEQSQLGGGSDLALLSPYVGVIHVHTGITDGVQLVNSSHKLFPWPMLYVEVTI